MIETTIQEGDRVLSADGYDLGVARSLHYRPAEEVNPQEQLYAVYLQVMNFEMGDEFYIPVDFLEPRGEEQEVVRLSVPVRFVQRRAWSRAPEFVAMQLGTTERLRRPVRQPVAA